MQIKWAAQYSYNFAWILSSEYFSVAFKLFDLMKTELSVTTGTKITNAIQPMKFSYSHS